MQWLNNVCYLIIIIILAKVCMDDLRKRIISNTNVLLIIFMVCILSLSADTSPNIFLSLFVLFFGFMLFISKILGAGDVKLIVALSFAFNYVQFINYLFLVAVLGGVCAIIGLLFYHKNVKKNGIPYGVPIALAFMLSYPVG